MAALAEASPPRPIAASLPRPRLFYGWWVVLSGAALQFLFASLMTQAFGTYIVLLHREFGWGKAVLAAASSLRDVENGLMGPLQGILLDRFAAPAVMRTGLVVLAGGFIAFSQVRELWHFYLAYLCMAIGVSLAGYVSVTYTAVQWFERRRATAISLASTGLALGGMAVPLTVLALEHLGWRQTAFLSACIVLFVGIPLTFLIRRRPADMGLEPDGDPPTVHGPDGVRSVRRDEGFTLREALHTPAFYWISLGHASSLFIVSALVVHLVSHLNQGLGYSLGAASLFVFLMTMVQFVGTLTGGPLGDRFNKRRLVIVCMGMHVAGILLLAHAANVYMIVAFTVLHGLAWGWRGPQMAAMRADYFGRANFGKILGVSNMIIIIGTISGPIIAGIVYDQTQSYRMGFDILAGIAAAGTVFFVLATKPKLPARLQGRAI
jgi:MFS family permease